MEFVIATLAVVVVAQAFIIVRTHERLFRAAMARTPGEYRAAEREVRKVKASPKSSLVELDEATQAVLADVTSGHPMPHGLGGE